MSRNKKIIVGVIIVLLIIVIGIIVAYKLIENSVTNRENFKFNVENISSNPVDTKSHEKYSAIIDNVKLELNIPNEWKYEEVPKDEKNDFYKYALKMYKNNEKQYAMLYFYNNPFGVCGTGRTAENITLNNGKQANIGYYDGNKIWSDISFYNINKNVAIMNNGLMDAEANEAIDVIKTINIIENNATNNNRSPENVIIEIDNSTISTESVSITITDNNDNHYGWGVEFRVQEKVNGEWKDLKYISDDLSWIDIAYQLNEDNQLTQKLEIEQYYGKLNNGIYRIVKPIYDNKYIDIYSNEFEIK